MKTVDIIWTGTLTGSTGPIGTLRRLLDSREYLLGQGIDLTIFSIDNHKGVKVAPSFSGSSVLSRTTKIKRRIRGWLTTLSKKSLLISKWMIERPYPGIESLVKDYVALGRTADVVEFHSGYEAYVYLKLTVGLKHPLTAVFFESDGIPQKMTTIYYPKIVGTRYYQKLMSFEQIVAEQADHKVFITHIGQVNYLNHFPFIKKEDTSVVVNGINDLSKCPKFDVEDFSNGYKYRLCCTGTINNRKGQRLIVEALSKLDDEHLKDIHVTFLGTGPDEQNLKEMVKHNCLEKNVFFAGNVNMNEVPSYLTCNNIFILTSYNEGLPISILEAMSLSMPIISTNVSGIPETVDNGYNGLLISPDSDELVTIFKKMDSFDWEKMASNSRKKFESQFTFDRMREDYCKMIHTVINKSKDQ